MSAEMAISVGLTGLTGIMFALAHLFESEQLEMKVFHYFTGYLFFLGTLFSLGKIASQSSLEQVGTVLQGSFWVGLTLFAAIIAYLTKEFGARALEKMADEYPESG